jgi:hypothetical protein
MNALVLDAAGCALLHAASGAGAANAWLVAVAAAHAAVGLAGTRLPRVSRELSLVALGLGVMLGDVAFAALTSGLPLVLAWSAGAVGFAGVLLGASGRRADAAFGAAGLGGHLLAALAHALVLDARFGAGAAGVDAILAVAAVGRRGRVRPGRRRTP